MKTKNQMFMRFYNKTEADVRAFAEKMKREYSVVDFKIGSLTASVNPFLPWDNNFQIDFYFKTKKDLAAFHQNPKTKEAYLEFSQIQKNEFVQINPGDVSFNPVKF